MKSEQQNDKEYENGAEQNDLQVDGELAQCKHGGITNVNIVISHAVIDLLQQRL